MDRAPRRHCAALDRKPSAGVVSLRTAPESVVTRLERLATLGATSAGIDRRLFSAADAAARAMFAAWARDAGLTVEQDRAGNVFARRAGRSDLAPILSGSHLDTVPTGGAYDGAYGAVAALCAIEQIEADGIAPNHPLEAVAWAGEEGSRFPLGCLGSAAFAGLNDLASIDALRDENGVTFAEARAGETGLLPDVPVRETTVVPAAYVELHIEQGPVLERRGMRLGNVTAIAGQARYEVVVTGESGHAGTVPMAMRRDALSAVAEVILALEASAARLPDSVLTIGRLTIEPNQSNVIPWRVTFRIDARSVYKNRLAALRTAVAETTERIAAARGVTIAATLTEERGIAAMDDTLRGAVAEAFAEVGVPGLDLPSGAGHDAMCVATVAPSAMIFVPSAGGHSHTAGEYTSPEDCELGVRALARSIVAIDRLAG